MASRCIKALNELDTISEKVLFKYSKKRFQTEIEGRVKASKSKVERSLDQNLSSKTRKRISSSSSSNGQYPSELNSATKARAAKSAANHITTPQLKGQRERAKTTGGCRKRANKTASCKRKEQVQENEAKSYLTKQKSPSVYGTHNQEEQTPKPVCWFNFEDGIKKGKIDSFVCDERKTKALCYTLNKKEGKSVPRLLHHRLEVRIGQNGDVRNTPALVKEKDLEDSRNTNVVKKIPLSWEEQLNWENASVKSPRSSSPQQTGDKALCETHPVIFNPKERTSTVSSVYDMNQNTAAYRMYLDRRLLVSDRGNLVCGGKCITSVELEDTRDEIEGKELKIINSSLKAYLVDVDRMDMSTTVMDIENIYPRRSTASKSSSMCNQETEVVEISTKVFETPAEFNESNESNRVVPHCNDSEKNDSITKRVSFKDEIDLTENQDGLKYPSIKAAEPGNVPRSPPKERPKSSKERSEASNKLGEKHRRPYTAPPCSPSFSLDETLEREIETHFRFSPIDVPTSELILSDQDDNSKEEKHFVNKGDLNSTTENAVDHSDVNISEGQSGMRVSIACKSAPTIRMVSRIEETEPISRSLSCMSSRTNRNKYVPPKPLAVLADSSVELPRNLPPAQALVDLRKKIREDLAKETADLQLDIQQLYLKHHSRS